MQQLSHFEHDNVVDSRVVERQGRKVLLIRTTLTLDEEGEGFDPAAVNDLCTAAAQYARSHPDINDCVLVRVRH